MQIQESTGFGECLAGRWRNCVPGNVARNVEENEMLKLTLAAALIVGAFAVPAMADDMMKCDEASMMKMDKDVEGMKDMAMKEKAMGEMTMAKDSMKMNKMDDCMMHMENAHKSMM
jgi:hypothetical protein